MLLRIWRVAINPGKESDLEVFAAQKSLPMFRAQPGCLGVFFTRSESACATVTIWDSPVSLTAMEESPQYRRVVRDIEQSGILGDDHRTEVLSVFGGHVASGLPRSLASLPRAES